MEEARRLVVSPVIPMSPPFFSGTYSKQARDGVKTKFHDMQDFPIWAGYGEPPLAKQIRHRKKSLKMEVGRVNCAQHLSGCP